MPRSGYKLQSHYLCIETYSEEVNVPAEQTTENMHHMYEEIARERNVKVHNEDIVVEVPPQGNDAEIKGPGVLSTQQVNNLEHEVRHKEHVHKVKDVPKIDSSENLIKQAHTVKFDSQPKRDESIKEDKFTAASIESQKIEEAEEK